MAGLNSVGFSTNENEVIWNLSAPGFAKCQMRSCSAISTPGNICALRRRILGSRRAKFLRERQTFADVMNFSSNFFRNLKRET